MNKSNGLTREEREEVRQFYRAWLDRNRPFMTPGEFISVESVICLLDQIDALEAELKREKRAGKRLEEGLHAIAAPTPDINVPDPDQYDEADLWMEIATKRRHLAKQALSDAEKIRKGEI